MALIVIVLLVILIGLSSYALYKIRKVHLMQFELLSQLQKEDQRSINLFRQLQSYDNLMKLLDSNISLPPLRGWAASPDFLLLIAEYARGGAEVIIECSSGASTLVLAQCSKLNGTGHVYSLEHDPKYARKTRYFLEKNKLTDWATVVDAPLKEYLIAGNEYRWYNLENLPELSEIDMLVIDGPPAHVADKARYPALPKLIDKFSKRCHVFLDDADRESEKSCIRLWSEEYKGININYVDCEKGCVEISFNNLC